jgi:CHAT domain-containing protein
MDVADSETVQAMLDPDETLIEYYAAGGRFHAFVISRAGFSAFRDIAEVGAVRNAVKGLSFQLSKFHLKTAYLEKHSALLFAAVLHHLGALYNQLIRPLREAIGGRRVLVVPHHALHYVPFHALYDGERFLIDDYEISCGASASVLKICRERVPAAGVRRDLILAVGDGRTPYIREEVDALRTIMPNARVFVGAEARQSVLAEYAPTAGKIHIAAHGIFRSDNPMFSSLRLGDTWLNLFDIFNLQLGAELTTLSACETGMSAVCEGDELLGLARGFLYAGTPSLVVSLWTVNDRSTAQLMRRFYAEMQAGMSKSAALRAAILEVKASFPHPYYWAPFILLGKS